MRKFKDGEYIKTTVPEGSLILQITKYTEDIYYQYILISTLNISDIENWLYTTGREGIIHKEELEADSVSLGFNEEVIKLLYF